MQTELPAIVALVGRAGWDFIVPPYPLLLAADGLNTRANHRFAGLVDHSTGDRPCRRRCRLSNWALRFRHGEQAEHHEIPEMHRVRTCSASSPVSRVDSP